MNVNRTTYYCLFYLLVSAIGAWANSNDAKGFLLTGPKQLLRGTEERFCLNIQGVHSAGYVNLELQSENGNFGLPLRQRIDPTKDDYGGCIPLVLSVPEEADTDSLKLKLKVDWDDPMIDLVIDSSTDISTSYQSQYLQLVQTDKAWYTPGQLVRFRTLTLNHLLQPVKTTLNRIWIVDPSNTVVAEWKNVSSDHQNGLLQLELQLSAEPVQGLWTINVDNKAFPETKEFEVKEYVLPRFEVSVKGPQSISPHAETLEFGVCAKYTFGQPVLGDVEAVVKLHRHRYWFRGYVPDDEPEVEPVNITGKIDKNTGCHQVVLPFDRFRISSENPSRYSIEITGHVTERGTQVKRNSTLNVYVRSQVTRYVMVDLYQNSPQTFQLGLPYIGQGVLSENPGNHPIRNGEVRVCVKEGFKDTNNSSWDHIKNSEEEVCTSVTADHKGHFVYSWLPKNRDAVRLSIEAKYENELTNSSGRGHMVVKPSHSPSNSFAMLQSVLNQPLACNSKTTVRVYFSNIEANQQLRVHYFLIARGDILAHGVTKEDQVRTVAFDLPGVVGETKSLVDISALDLDIDILPSFYPEASLLVYYTREDGEVVTAQTEIKVASCFPNPVTLQWDADTRYPGSVAALNLHASPGSLCGLSVVDKSVTLTKPEWQLKEDTILGRLGSFNIYSYVFPRQETPDYQYCQSKFPPTTEAPNVDGDNFIETRDLPRNYGHWNYISFYADAIRAFDEAGLLVMSNWNMQSRPCEQFYREYRPMIMRGPVRPMVATAEMDSDTDGLREMDYSITKKKVAIAPPAAPTVDLRAYFPETWLWDLHSTDLNGEVKIEKELPHTITSWVGRAICVSDQTGFGMSPEATITAFQPFFLELHLPYSIKRGEKLTLKVSVYNYLASTLPITVAIDSSNEFELLSPSSTQSTCIDAKDSTVVEFVIRPTALGRLNVTVRGEVDPATLQGCGTEDLPTARDALVKPLLVIPEGFPVETTYARLMCPHDITEDKTLTWDLSLPDDVVNGSARAWVSVVGDLMGPALEGLTSLVRLPTGCGEQNMVTFTPLVFVSEYLEASHQLDEKLEKKVISYMQSGYQRELTYRHSDGSYSAFGPRDASGSLWLTSFVIKSFAGARKFVFIDNENLEVSINWTLSKQLDNGCFPVVGTVLSKELKGGLASGEEELGGLTAFTLVSLLESRWNIDRLVIENAIKCLKNQKPTNLYTEALITYALVLSKDETARSYLDTLISKAQQKDSNIWWEETGKGRSISVETTSYALLALLQFQTKDDMVKASNIVRWLTKQRNSKGGFPSTQDTVMGLQALASYATVVGTTDIDLGLQISADKLEDAISVKEKDKLVQRQVQIPTLPTKLHIEATGTGCAVVQATMRYNVHTTEQKKAFALSLKSEPVGDESACAARQLEICIKYLLPGSSNMAILELDMISGYAVEKTGFQKLPTTNSYVKRAEEKDNRAVLYFDGIDQSGICANISVWPAFKVNDALPANIKISDYYEQEKYVSESYLLPTGCALIAPPITDNEV